VLQLEERRRQETKKIQESDSKFEVVGIEHGRYSLEDRMSMPDDGKKRRPAKSVIHLFVTMIFGQSFVQKRKRKANG
jgi:hypothetical protein